MSSNTLLRSHNRCPWCGSPLYYVDTAFTFLTGYRKRLCRAPNCTYVEPGRFKIEKRTQA